MTFPYAFEPSRDVSNRKAVNLLGHMRGESYDNQSDLVLTNELDPSLEVGQSGVGCTVPSEIAI